MQIITQEYAPNASHCVKCGVVQTLTAVITVNVCRHCVSALSPVCAITGGILAQEIIKAVSQRDVPHNNFFFYNGLETSGMVDRIG